MYVKAIILLLALISFTTGQPGKCNQTPPQAKVLTPSENNGIYELTLVRKDKDTRNLYLPDQTYVLLLSTTNQTRPFRWFMITAEDPDVDNSNYEFEYRASDVGILKTLDTDRQSRYSERCYSSVENTDNSEKYQVEIHWVSPKQSDTKQRVRLRAMIAENEEVWYTGEGLTIELEKNDNKPIDSPPYLPTELCNLCSEARYEVIFKGQWSRVSHPRHYPRKPDDNGYSHLIGASHSYYYSLWQQGTEASPGLRSLAEQANISMIEREIITSISETGGTRTLIRGKRRHHPHMMEHSHSLFRVDKIHHLFSVVIAMKPSPDWFLGATQFELCTEDGWLEESEIPLYPWDAGTMNGISYESPKTMTQPVGNIERVAVGSFDTASPFYQMNLIDLKPFAHLQVRRLDVYPLEGVECNNERANIAPKPDAENNEEENEKESEEPVEDEPRLEESRQRLDKPTEKECLIVGEWSDWSSCVADVGSCGIGTQIRNKYEDMVINYENNNMHNDVPKKAIHRSCSKDKVMSLIESQDCYVEC